VSAPAAGGSLRVAVTLEQCWHRVPGGVARAAVEHTRAVADGEAGIEQVGVSAYHRSPPEPPYVPPVPVRQLPLGRRALYESWHRLRRPRVERATGAVDVTHATGLAIPGTAAPLVVTVHDLAWERWPEFFTRHGVRFFRRSMQLTRAEAAVVVCPSEATAVDVVNAGMDPGRVRIVPWGVDQTTASAAEVTAARARHGLDRPYVLWVGTLEPRKNVTTVVDGFRRLGRDDLDLVLVGPAGWKEQVPASAAELGDRLHLVGFVSDTDLRALYGGAEVFCYPSLLEGFGFPVLEAMVQGTPVVTSQGTATGELLGPGGEAIDPRSDEALAAGLEAVLADRERYAAAAVARSARYTWARTAAGLVAAYRSAARA
jgi:glycosyltransferase involved in cell wall biosynthesis